MPLYEYWLMDHLELNVERQPFGICVFAFSGTEFLDRILQKPLYFILWDL